MVYQNFEQLAERMQGTRRQTVAVAAAHDPHALEAVFAAQEEGFAAPILVGDRERIRAMAASLGHALPCDIVEAGDDLDAAAKAVSLVREGTASFLMKGRLETATLMRAVLDKDAGIRAGGFLSHVGILQIPAYHKLVAVTDGGMVPHPTLEQKKRILTNAVKLLDMLGYERPKVSVLTASESVNERQPETAEAAWLAQMALDGELPPCTVAGPISFDLTFSAETAAIKGYRSPVTGDADILVVPDMVCGNVLAKSLQCMAGARMAGCVVGAGAPIVLTSRGATAEEKHLSILLAAAAAGRKEGDL